MMGPSEPPAERVTLTLPAVGTARQVWLLVAGAEKAEAAAHVVAGSPAVEWPTAGARGMDDTILSDQIHLNLRNFLHIIGTAMEKHCLKQKTTSLFQIKLMKNI